MSRAGFDAALSRAQALNRAVEALEEQGIAEARGDARILVLHALSLTQAELALRPGIPIGETGAEALDHAIRRRRSGEPVARILDEWEFWGLPFWLSPHTLVPRPDTETLVETALRTMVDRPRPWRILDLGTGSGCILVALLSERPNALGVGTDLSLGAILTARRNAARNGVGARATFLRGDWFEAVRGPFDLIVSNPPYIARSVIATLAVEVRRHDPMAALDGGEDGLFAYRAIIGGLAARLGLLAPEGAVVLEIGYDQADAVAGLGRDAGFGVAGIDRDLAGHERVVTLRPPFDVTSKSNKVVR